MAPPSVKSRRQTASPSLVSFNHVQKPDITLYNIIFIHSICVQMTGVDRHAALLWRPVTCRKQTVRPFFYLLTSIYSIYHVMINKFLYFLIVRFRGHSPV